MKKKIGDKNKKKRKYTYSLRESGLCKKCGKLIYYTGRSLGGNGVIRNADGIRHVCDTEVKVYTQREIQQYLNNIGN